MTDDVFWLVWSVCEALDQVGSVDLNLVRTPKSFARAQVLYAIVISCALYTWRGVPGPSYILSLNCIYVTCTHHDCSYDKMAGRLDDLL